MVDFDYKQFYEEVGKHNGWDFSKLKVVTEGQLFDLYKEAAKLCNNADIVLDIGTGGGEASLSLTASALLLVGIDQSKAMIETATKNTAKANIHNAKYINMDAERLAFPANFFNVVTCRHSPFTAREVARVLVDKGMFLTQQVSENDKINLKAAFGRGQSFEKELQLHYMKELTEAGFRDIKLYELNVTEYYETAEDLIFLLKHAPIIPNFGQSDDDFNILRQFILDNQTDKGIKTNAARFVITATI